MLPICRWIQRWKSRHFVLIVVAGNHICGVRKADVVRVIKLLWSPERAEREIVEQLKLALREQTDNERAMQPEHQRLLPPGWKRKVPNTCRNWQSSYNILLRRQKRSARRKSSKIC